MTSRQIKEESLADGNGLQTSIFVSFEFRPGSYLGVRLLDELNDERDGNRNNEWFQEIVAERT